MPPVRLPRLRAATSLTLVAGLALVPAGCGEKDEPAVDDSTQAAPEAAQFPAAGNGTIEDVYADNGPTQDLVVASAGSDYVVGDNRFGFAVFETDRTQITDAKVAIYAAHGPNGKVEGPFPARVESLETEPAFTAQTTSGDPDAAKAVYVTDLPLDQPGEWRLVALVGQDGAFQATRMPSIVAKTPAQDKVPEAGDKAPVIHTPTVDDVADVTDIDTRVPPDDMHDVDFADVVGKKPVALLFSTPQLCQSRVCGPVTDMELQMKSKYGDQMDFIHQEVYVDNDINKGLRPPLKAFNLPSEPWLFVVNAKGVITARLEGSIGVQQFENAVKSGL
jgi:hypothetical protein